MLDFMLSVTFIVWDGLDLCRSHCCFFLLENGKNVGGGVGGETDIHRRGERVCNEAGGGDWDL